MSASMALTPEGVTQRHPGWQVHQTADGFTAVREAGGEPISAGDLGTLDWLIGQRDTQAKAA